MKEYFILIGFHWTFISLWWRWKDIHHYEVKYWMWSFGKFIDVIRGDTQWMSIFKSLETYLWLIFFKKFCYSIKTTFFLQNHVLLAIPRFWGQDRRTWISKCFVLKLLKLRIHQNISINQHTLLNCPTHQSCTTHWTFITKFVNFINFASAFHTTKFTQTLFRN